METEVNTITIDNKEYVLRWCYHCARYMATTETSPGKDRCINGHLTNDGHYWVDKRMIR